MVGEASKESFGRAQEDLADNFRTGSKAWQRQKLLNGQEVDLYVDNYRSNIRIFSEKNSGAEIRARGSWFLKQVC